MKYCVREAKKRVMSSDCSWDSSRSCPGSHLRAEISWQTPGLCPGAGFTRWGQGRSYQWVTSPFLSSAANKFLLFEPHRKVGWKFKYLVQSRGLGEWNILD